jgi:hypothetical protein
VILVARPVHRYQPSEAFLSRCETQALRHLGSFKAKELAGLVHALGKLGHRCRDAFCGEVVAVAVARRREFPPQETTSLLKGLAAVGHTAVGGQVGACPLSMCERG